MIRDVSLILKVRKIVGLVGENGAGRSTLVKVLAGIYCPDGGTICFKGKTWSISLIPEKLQRLAFPLFNQ